MMKYYKNNNGAVYAYDEGQTPIDGLTLMTSVEVEAHINPPLTAAQITAQITIYRKQKVNGGITVSGVTVQTDSESRTNILGAKELNIGIDWKTDNGFETFTAAQIAAIATAVGTHVQKCFSAEKTVSTAHAVTPYTSIDAVETAFDNAYND